MRIPKQIDVFGKRWKISYKWNLRCEDGQPMLGLCVPDKRIIFLERLTKKSERPSIFFHELLHAIIYESKIAAVLDENVEEILVESIEEVVMEMFTLRLKNGKKR